MRVQHLFLKPNKKKLFAIHFLYFSYMDSQRASPLYIKMSSES
jgi:hypothetical protein